jgi:4'-phosphopantetheinyl transferase EntD
MAAAVRIMELAELLPAAASCRELWGFGNPATLLPAEAECAAGFAVSRLREFAAGRCCARLALADLGAVSAPLLVGTRREPLWPPGFTGSITHTAGYCAAAACRVGSVVSLGIDAERIVAVDRAERQALFCPAEIDWLESLASPEQTAMACAMFSAKESYFKCTFPLTRRWLEFKEVELRFGARSFAVLDGNADSRLRVHGSYGFIGNHDIVATAVVATSNPEGATTNL